MLHAQILNLSRLAVGHSLALLHLVGDEEVDDLQCDDGEQGAGDAHDFGEARLVLGRILGVEEKGANNVTGRGSGIVQGHDDGLFGGTRNVGDHPRDNEGVAAEEEGKHVVRGQERRNAVPGENIEHDRASKDRGENRCEEG